MSSSNIKVKVKKPSRLFVNQTGVVRKLDDISDVDVSSKEDGSLLVYSETQNKFLASKLLDKQEINGGNF